MRWRVWLRVGVFHSADVCVCCVVCLWCVCVVRFLGNAFKVFLVIGVGGWLV